MHLRRLKHGYAGASMAEIESIRHAIDVEAPQTEAVKVDFIDFVDFNADKVESLIAALMARSTSNAISACQRPLFATDTRLPGCDTVSSDLSVWQKRPSWASFPSQKVAVDRF